MTKIVKKFLSTILVLSLLAGFSASVASFASSEDIPDVPYVYEIGDNAVEGIKTDEAEVVAIFRTERAVLYPVKATLISEDTDNNTLYYEVGHVIYGVESFSIGPDRELYLITGIFPGDGSDEIVTLQIPNFINGKAISGLVGTDKPYNKTTLDIKFPKLEKVILPSTLTILDEKAVSISKRPLQFVRSFTGKFLNSSGEISQDCSLFDEFEKSCTVYLPEKPSGCIFM